MNSDMRQVMRQLKEQLALLGPADRPRGGRWWPTRGSMVSFGACSSHSLRSSKRHFAAAKFRIRIRGCGKCQRHTCDFHRREMPVAYEMLDTCLLVPGLSRSECASWVQAWGSIAAIGVAIWLGRRSEAGAQRGAVNHYILFKVAGRDAMAAVLKAAAVHDVGKMQYARARLHDALKLGDTVALDRLPEIDALTTIRFRSVIAQAYGFLDHAIDTSGNTLSFQHINGEFTRMFDEVNRIDEEARV